MQGTCECIIWRVQTLQVNGGTCNTSKENVRAQAPCKFPLRHDCICSHTACTQTMMCMPVFIAGSVQPRHSVIKSHVYLKCPFQISQFFSVTRMYVHVRWDVREALAILSD